MFFSKKNYLLLLYAKYQTESSSLNILTNTKEKKFV